MILFAVFSAFIGYAALFDLLVYGVCCLFGWAFNIWAVTTAGLVMSFITCLFMMLYSAEDEWPEDEDDEEMENEDDGKTES